MNINYNFTNKELLTLALSHPSISKINNLPNYERLEFLGDRVIGLILAEYLYHNFSNLAEGRLALIQAKIVSRPVLSEIARSIDLGASLKMDNGEAASGGRDNAKNLEDALEALVGAIFLDGGFPAAKKFVLHHWQKYLAEDHAALITKDPKSMLQEWAQKDGKPIPVYKTIEQSGPDHNPLFIVEVCVEKMKAVRASGNSKKDAEVKAATLLLEQINQFR